MSNPTPVASFRTGSDAAQEVAESTRGGRFPRAQYLILKDGESVYLRFLQEERDPSDPDIGWKSVLQHVMEPTRPAPAGHTGKWPQNMDATCRRDEAFKAFGFPDCYPCDHPHMKPWGKMSKVTARTWSYAVVREEVIEGGRRTGFKDAEREEAEIGPDGKPTGQTHMVPDVRIVSYGWDEFFKKLKGYSVAYGGTVMDRDYFVKREPKGNGQKGAEYLITPCDRIPMVPPSVEHPEGVYWDLSAAGLAKLSAMSGQPVTIEGLYPNIPDIVGILVERASDEYHDRFFDLRHAQPQRKAAVENDGPSGSTDSGAEAVAAVPAPNVDPASFEALKARLAGGGSTPA